MAKLRRFGATPVAEGVRLEVGKYTVFAVRNAEKDICVRVRREPRQLLRSCMRIPFVRGVTRLIRDVVRFFDGLNESSEFSPQKPVRGTRPERCLARLLHIQPQTIVTAVTVLLTLLLAAVFLFLAPAAVQLLLEQSALPLSRGWLSEIAALARGICLLLGTMLLCRMRVFRRLAMYKGAINQVLNCYESRDEVNPENAAQYPITTRRSESAFVLSVLCVSLLFFPLIRPIHPALTALLRLAILLLVAAVLNEPFLALEEAEPSLPVRILRAPLYVLQHLTTLEPHPRMLEVALCAFDAAMGKPQEETEEEVNPDDDRGVVVPGD